MIGVKNSLNRHKIIESADRLDPLKYNGGQLIHLSSDRIAESLINTGVSSESTLYKLDVQKGRVKNVLNVDWFETTILMENLLINQGERIDVQLGESVYLINRFKSTQRYNHLWRVIFMGEEIGSLLTNPKSSIMKSNQAQFKMDNHLLYTKDWLDTYKDLLEDACWTHNNVTRYDIAVDGAGATKALNLAERQMKGGKTKRKGKASFRPTFDPSNGLKRFFVGSSSSDKVATIYPKSVEIEHSGKEYIINSWEHNGLNVSGTVDRFELRLKSGRMNNYDWRRLDQLQYVASILKTECKNWFEFYYESKDTNKYRKYKNTKEMEWIDWESIAGELLPKNKAVVKSGMHRAKRVIKDMIFFHEVDGMEIDKRIIFELIDEYSLQKWYADRIDYWQSEFRRERKYRNINSN